MCNFALVLYDRSKVKRIQKFEATYGFIFHQILCDFKSIYDLDPLKMCMIFEKKVQIHSCTIMKAILTTSPFF